MIEEKKILLSLAPEVYNKLLTIKDKKNKSSVTDVIRDALNLYDYIYEETINQDNTLCIKNTNKKELKELVLI